MKKHNISRKKRTYKKYNRTQFRHFNKYTNLSHAMKGGWPFGYSRSKMYRTNKEEVPKDSSVDTQDEMVTNSEDVDYEQEWFDKKNRQNHFAARKNAHFIADQLKAHNSRSFEVQFKDELAWLLLKVEQDPSIALEQMDQSKDEIVQLLQITLNSSGLPSRSVCNNLLGLLNKYKSKSRDELHEGINLLISKVEQDPSIAVNQLKKSKEQVIEWLIQNLKILEQKDSIEWPTSYDLGYLVKLIDLYKGISNEDELSFLSRIKNLIANPWPPSRRIGSRTRPETLPYFTDKHFNAKYGIEPHRLTSDEIEKVINPIKDVTPYPRPDGYGGKSKYTFKRNVKSKKRRKN